MNIMNIISRAATALGLQPVSGTLKAALVSQQRQQISVEQLFDCQLPQEETDLSALPSGGSVEQAELLNLSTTAIPVSAMAAQETLVRALEIKLKKEKEIDSVLSFQAEPLIPYPVEEAILDKLLLQPTADGTLLTLLAVKRQHLQNHLAQLKLLDLEPESVTSTPLALVAFSAFLLPEKPPHFVLYLGEEQICCVFAREGKLIASQASNLTLAQLNLETDPTKGMKGSDKAVEELQQEIHRLLFSLMKQVKELQMPQILLTGKGSTLGALTELLLQNVQKQLLAPEQPKGTEIPLAQLQGSAIPIGAALTALPQMACQVNFRQQEFAYPYPWKKWQTPFCFYIGACLAATVALVLFKMAYVGAKEDEIRQAYAQLLQHANVSYEAFEKNLNPASTPAEAVAMPPNLKMLTAEGIQYRVQKLEKELQSTPDLFPLHPNVPRVSDLLAWLTSHPKAIKSEKEGGTKSLIQLESFNYTMLKRPDNTKKQEKYQVKVEFEFSSMNPTVAREFHEALLAPNEFVDPKLELKWSSEKGKYKAVFFLKDKTSYS